ncbi:prefoldin subunit 3 isoform X3 [Rissa tridactyla]|uniref:prefoldin subunit 3 isoform X3 n=1 Tax=Rissa tridactyla TaxID=75485 RepID=UPI0023BAD030|nr:prefoldin subunit 3 isoform X3 [Rissa tridactyla]
MAAATSSETGCGEAAAGEKRGPLGIPEAVFVEDVDSFMKQPGNETADVVLKKLDEQYQKYKFLELNLAQKKRSVKAVCIALLQKTSEPQYAEAGEAAAEMPLHAVPFKPAFVSLESCYEFRVLEWRLKSQIPEIKQTLEILKHMQKKKDSTNPMETRFLLADNLYCKASVPPTDKVCLWLGQCVALPGILSS